jgi:hypothetical protein
MQRGNKKGKKDKKGKIAWVFAFFALFDLFVSAAPFAMEPDFKNISRPQRPPSKTINREISGGRQCPR